MAKKTKSEAGRVGTFAAWTSREVERCSSSCRSTASKNLNTSATVSTFCLKKAVGTADSASADRSDQLESRRAAAAYACGRRRLPARAPEPPERGGQERSARRSSRDQVARSWAPSMPRPVPDADPFVTVGSQVEERAGALHHRSMKLMNEIESDVAGEVGADLRRERPSGRIWRTAVRHPPGRARNRASVRCRDRLRK